ncbi:histone h1oo [Plakobranchus ocellatus]|uniref:Histone h1oo n=1 Tax=Plakobranchus ocellatus TaxID=259542 RepID=A0AAV4D5E6_9GAST|nr:histone h1oo [Plakobranchus ocellatus]
MSNPGTDSDRSFSGSSTSPIVPPSTKAIKPSKKVMSPKSPSARAKLASPKKPAHAKPAHPPLFNAVLAVLQAGKGGKGLSLQAIKRGVVDSYPDMQENFSNVRLRKAITKGIEQGAISRPKGDEEAGFTGRFILNKTYVAEKEKEAKRKLKAKLKAEAQAKKKAEKQLKSPKPKAKRPPSTALTKSPGRKSLDAKKRTDKSREAVKQNPKSPKAKKMSALNKIKMNTPKTAKNPKAVKTLKSRSKIVANKMPRATAASTPKISKSATAGAKQKVSSYFKIA